MRIMTLLRFLIGDRAAILKIARQPAALWIGLLFVIAAGLAREYDGEYLVAEPWYVAIPAVASLCASFLLYALIRCLWRRTTPERPSFWSGYRAFITLFWMTAPLAWLYAIPYERFLTAYDATVINLWTLLIVSVWRVVLITRVVSVLTGVSFVGALMPVMLFADVAAFLGLLFSPMPLVGIMGGIRHEPADMLTVAVRMNVMVLGVFSSPVWLIGTCVAAVKCRPAWTPVREPLERTDTASAKSAWALALGAIALGIAALPLTQPEQRAAWTVNQHFDEEQIDEALAYMSARTPRDFPPHYDPRPRNWPGQTIPRIWDIVPNLADASVAPWVRNTYLRKLRATMDRYVETHEQHALLDLLEQIPEGPQFARDQLEQLEEWAEYRFKDNSLKAEYLGRVRNLANR